MKIKVGDLIKKSPDMHPLNDIGLVVGFSPSWLVGNDGNFYPLAIIKWRGDTEFDHYRWDDLEVISKCK